jgi:hypothetical protein
MGQEAPMAESTLHPEIHELLIELAGDPNSRLLRIPRAQALQVGALAVIPSASAGSADWNCAERQLLRVHREEVAALFIRAFRAKVSTHERAAAYWNCAPPEGESWGEVITPIVADAKRLQAVEIPDHGDSLLGGLLQQDPADLPDLLSLALGAERLSPGPSRSLYRAAALVTAGRYEDCETLLGNLEPSLTDRGTRAMTWTILGVGRTLRGMTDETLDAYTRAWQLAPHDDGAAVGVFLNALHACNGTAARVSGLALDELLTAQAVAPHVHMTRLRLENGSLCFGPETQKLHDRLEPSLGPVARTISRALFAN